MNLCDIKKKNQEFWEACFRAPSSNCRRLTKGSWQSLIQRLRENDAKRVLDLGCGHGHWSIVLARAGFSVKAVDYAHSAIEKLKQWAKTESLAVECEMCDIKDIKYVREFDAVICNSVLDHMMVRDAGNAIEKIGCACKKSGVVYVSFDGPAEECGRFRMLEDGTRYYMTGGFENMLWRYYTDEEIRVLCKQFAIERFGTRRNGKRDVWLRRR